MRRLYEEPLKNEGSTRWVFLEALRESLAISRPYIEFGTCDGPIAIWQDESDRKRFGWIDSASYVRLNDAEPVGIVMTAKGVGVLTSEGSAPVGKGAEFTALWLLQDRSAKRIGIVGTNAYLRGYREFSKARCYVGRTRRHNLECQVVNGVEGPGFARVSPAFEMTDGKIGYYAEWNGWLFRMEIPLPMPIKT